MLSIHIILLFHLSHFGSSKNYENTDMIHFYQKRDFGGLISDSFNFFKVYGKNYFKNYFLINGVLLLLMVVILVVGFGQFFAQLFGSNTEGQSYYFEQYFQENEVMLIGVIIGFFILAAAITVVAYSFPVFYLKRVAESGKPDVTTDQILSDIKSNLPRLLYLFLGLTFVVTPIFLVIFSISYLLVLIIIGFFILMILMPFSINVVNFLMYDYLQTKKSFFSSLSYALRAQFSYSNANEKSPFWKYVGSTFVLFIIYYIVSLIFTMIPMIIFYGALFTIPQNGQPTENPFTGTMGIVIFMIYALSLIVSYIMMNLILINSGLMYYDNRTDIHQKLDMVEIDSIGSNEV